MVCLPPAILAPAVGPDYHLRQSIAASPHRPCCLSLQFRSEDLRGHDCIITHLTLADICRRRPLGGGELFAAPLGDRGRSEEHTSELQSLMRISYAVFCLKKKKNTTDYTA